MAEIRFNPVTGDWVIVAKERSLRPGHIARKKEARTVPPYVKDCPFCPGNEQRTPSETHSVKGADGTWLIRAVPNKFSALSPQGELVKQKESRFRQSISGVGRHEVIIETPDHSASMALLPLTHIEAILRTYRDRILEFYGDPRVQHAVIFKNYGEMAGTSLEHPHSQIVGMPVVPGQVMDRLELALRGFYFVHYGDCLYCSLIEDELADGARIVSDNSLFVSFVPYAALSPFHLWILPKTHRSCFSEIADSEIPDLALMLKDALLRLYVGLDNPDFNYAIRCVSPEVIGTKCFHWYVAIIPRLSHLAGFEMGTGMYINQASPEENAKFLREVNLHNLP